MGIRAKMPGMLRFGRRSYPFQGWDWTELAEYFAIGPMQEPFDADHPQEWAARETQREAAQLQNLQAFCWAHGDDPAVVGALRAYLHQAIKGCHSPDKPIWQGLARIREPHTFVKYYGVLLPGLWT